MVGFEPTICDPNQGATRLPSDTIITSILHYKYTILLDTLQKMHLFCAFIVQNELLHSPKRDV